MSHHDTVEKDVPSLGTKLRSRRKQKLMTMQQVADQAGLSVGFISQVERDLTVPSLSSLASIAHVLDQPIGAFLSQPDSSQDLTRRANRVSYTTGRETLSYERLSASFPGSTLRAVLTHEKPGHRGEPISHDGEELMLVLAGELTVEIEGEVSVLREGDSIHFDSRRTHSTWNHTDDVTTIMWCGTMDVFGDGEPDPIHTNGTTANEPANGE
ncbi:helix-turn-helix domain-containing protein [Qingshengfaniella alkalisoli]|uniref:Cupin domain-containing protein n=1 Tax=Qingshengfaniella alkalisoli TaxID=2599296 RepID=A0A5B8I8Q1_9RHOB|nr:cupin domain-containing protein [Qingshengfaniella alkalisoli]QDY70445.1 cupin domain-containing protein [Qingshengfaniella alkalisoli]